MFLFVSELAAACAKIYENCGDECKKHDYEHCQNCAKACLTCAESCRKLIS
ncbi:four-helix bundle copper-binding protein [Peribacillus sp. NPDC097675]|uniref:four-helix bundle copper-binding protein n=1 Tax=Peribacillus sp. NPDC097675 TaxID=3390618 RepID=UPI003CFE9E95